MLLLRSLISFLILPGMLAGVVPYWILGYPRAHGPLLPAGLALLAAGLFLLLWCVRDFMVSGRGTLAPWDPPRHLVVVGLYRCVRNPMYWAVLTIVLGWAITFHSKALVAYAGGLLVMFHLRVLLHEEPWLLKQFGPEWIAYSQAVPRWLPRQNRLVPPLLLVAGIAAYANTLSAPFLFDDQFAIRDNATIRKLTDIGTVLSPPTDGSSVDGRPVVNLSFALNYAIGGLDVRGYHVTNLAIHLLAGLALYGILRRTLPSGPLACFVALIWMLHPLQTESVTCVVQRTESLLGLFLLLTLYCFIRARPSSAEPTAGKKAGVWMCLSALSCFFGMATKEIMAVAPVLVLLYDRTFMSGSFRAAVRERWKVHAALFSTWILLAWLVFSSGASRAGHSGLTSDATPWTYALTQCRAIIMYLRLSIWPHPLVLDYGTGVETRLTAVLPQAVLLVLLLAATVYALWRRPAWGFAGAWFFLILGPSSSFVPLATQTMAEHRMYLPLAAVVAVLAVAIRKLCGRWAVLAGAIAVLGFGALTYARNAEYGSSVSIWEATVRDRPENPRARNNLGEALLEAGRHEEALGELQIALTAAPTVESHALMGLTLQKLGRLPEAEAHLRAALRLDPSRTQARLALGSLLARSGKFPEAALCLEDVLKAEPDNATAHCDLGSVYYQTNRLADAARHYESAAALRPEYVEAHYNLAMARADQGRFTDAIAETERALQLQPDLKPAQSLLMELQARLRPGQK